MNKLELLSEHPDCTEDQLKEIAGLHQALNGIIRLNKSLLLLSRIDNKQFPETRDICLNHLIHKILEGINDIYERKALHLRVSEKESLVCTMNESLATTLITNLIKNAYVHNYEKGDIGITISRRMLTIANTGIDKTLDKELLFARFASQVWGISSEGKTEEELAKAGHCQINSRSIFDPDRLPIRKWHAYIHITILLTAEIPNFFQNASFSLRYNKKQGI